MTDLDPIPMERTQIRHLADAKELWLRYLENAKLRAKTRGAMGWKEVRGKEYLTWYWTDPLDGRKHMKSLGARSADTEATKSKFEHDRVEADRATDRLKMQIEPLIRVGRALRVGRLDPAASTVLRSLAQEGMLGSDLFVAGSAALHLYEAATGTLLPRSVISEGDLDLVLKAPRGPAERLDDLLATIRRGDKSFRLQTDALGFRNADGFRVHLHLLPDIERSINRLDGISDEQVEVLREALHLEPARAVTVGRDGSPVEIVGLDPRAFALTKFARSAFDPDRDGPSARLDHDQAFSVGRMVLLYGRQSFEPDQLAAFPSFAEQVESGDPEAASLTQRLFGP